MDGPERNVNVCKMTQENFNASPSTSIIRISLGKQFRKPIIENGSVSD